MGFELAGIKNDLIKKQSINAVIQCNETTSEFRLILSNDDAREIVETREDALISNGRFELGGGIITKIINAFCRSPYITQSNYAQTINELIELFYYFKTETKDKVDDDSLIEFMSNSFDNVCQGSVELLGTRELERVARNINLHRRWDETESNRYTDDNEEYNKKDYWYYNDDDGYMKDEDDDDDE